MFIGTYQFSTHWGFLLSQWALQLNSVPLYFKHPCVFDLFQSMDLAQLWNYKYLADAFALVKSASPQRIANQDWTNTLSVFIAGHRGHSNGKTRLQMLFPLPKLIANKCAFCQKGEKKKLSPVEKLFLCWVQVPGSLCGPKISICLLVLFSQDCLAIIILLLIQCLFFNGF